MMFQGLIERARRDLGVLGMVAIVFITGGAALHHYVVNPLEARNDVLRDRLARQAAHDRASDARLLRDAAPAAKLSVFYRFFQNGKTTTEWLGKLGDIAGTAGVELASAEYRMQKSDSRIARYEIVLPLSGSYAHIRAFLEKALEEIPVLSLDQVSFRRNNAGDAKVQADARLTLHLLQEEAQ